MAETAPNRRRLIVSGADAPFFGLLRGLLTSLRRRRAVGDADIGILDGGLRPEQRGWLEAQGILVRPAEWGFDFPLARHLERERPSLKVLLSRPRLLLLDEPSMGLAPRVVEDIFTLIGKIARDGVALLLVEQNARLALELADRGYVMEGGRIVLAGAGGDLLRDPRVHSAYLGERPEG